MSGNGSATVVVPTHDAERLDRMLGSIASGDHQTIVVDNGSGGSVASICAAHEGAERGQPRDATSASPGRSTSAPAARRANGSCCSTTTASAIRGSSSAITAPIDPAAGVVMAAAVMRDWARPLADRQRRHGARPDAPGLGLPQRRAADRVERRGRGSDRALGGRGGLRPLDLPRGRRLRRAPVRLLGGRRPGPAASLAAGCAACSPRTRSATTSIPRRSARARPARTT